MSEPKIGDVFPYTPGVDLILRHIGKRRVRLNCVTDYGTKITLWVTHREWPNWSAAHRAAEPREGGR